MDIQSFLGELPFVKLLGIELTEIGDGYAEATLTMREELSWSAGELLAHGGVTFTLAETAGAAALLAHHEPPVFTIDARIDYIASSEGDLRARANIVREGSTTGVVAVDMIDEHEENIAKATIVYEI